VFLFIDEERILAPTIITRTKINARCFQCTHCAYLWLPRVELPKRCPRCGLRIDYAVELDELRMKKEEAAAKPAPSLNNRAPNHEEERLLNNE
jgi:Zn-finger nucleic acid-binding protein